MMDKSTSYMPPQPFFKVWDINRNKFSNRVAQDEMSHLNDRESIIF